MELLGPHAILVLGLTVAAFILFTIRRVPVELTSIGVLVVLPVSFVIFPYQADGAAIDPRDFFYGFGHEALIAICALMIIGQGLVDTGALNPVTAQLAKLWRRGPQLGLLVMLVACLAISGVLNDTPIVVLMIPVLVALARETGDSSARLLMPMNFAVLIGGMATTIGTSTNLLVVAIAADLGAVRFGVFDFTALVALAALLALPYLWLLAPRLLPAGRGADQVPVERIYDAVLHVPEDSELIGVTLGELRERSKQSLQVRELRRGENMSVARLPMVKLAAGDRLVVSDTAKRLKGFEDDFGLALYNAGEDAQPISDTHPLNAQDSQVAEVIVLPGSPMIGSAIGDLHVAERFDVIVLGAYRATGGAMLARGEVSDIVLEAGDVLLVQGGADAIAGLKSYRGVVVVDGAIVGASGTRRGKLAIAIMAAVVALAATKLLPMYLAALGGVLAMLLFGCLKAKSVANALKTDVILLVVASLALGKALVDTGGTATLAQSFVAMVAGWPPLAIVGALLSLVAVLTNFVSNNAAAAIGTPIAIEVARRLGVPADPFVLAILFGCNLSYATPIGYQTNLLVMSAARYRFSDFLRVGGPLVILMAATLTFLLGWRYGLLAP